MHFGITAIAPNGLPMLKPICAQQSIQHDCGAPIHSKPSWALSPPEPSKHGVGNYLPSLVVARDVLDRFHAMMRSKDEARLDPWMTMAAASSKLAAFAAGIEADKDAVAAAISSPWSSGQVEGSVNRLKSIKRQMYGRAKIDLLKARVMAPA